jgi:hypothetical protein
MVSNENRMHDACQKQILFIFKNNQLVLREASGKQTTRRPPGREGKTRGGSRRVMRLIYFKGPGGE